MDPGAGSRWRRRARDSLWRIPDPTPAGADLLEVGGVTPETLRIETLVAGGDGMARPEGGRVTFIRGAAPGDVVLAAIDEVRPHHRSAHVLEVLQPGPARRLPPCPEAGACGGCPWMHLSDDGQASAARDILEAALRRAHASVDAGAVRGALAPPRRLGARQRMRLHLDLRREPVAGFLRAASHDVHPVAACLALEPALESVRQAVARALPALQSALGRARAELQVDLPRDDAGAALLRVARGTPARAQREALAILQRAAPVLTALAARAPDAEAVSLGDDAIAFRRGPLEEPLRWPAFLSPGGFLQAGREGNALLVSRVLAAARSHVVPGGRVLELFAGSGNLTLPLAGAGLSVEASDEDRAAIANAARAAAACAGEIAAPRLEACAATAHAQRAAAEGLRYDAVLLDPPRTGAKEVAPLLPALTDVVISVSCDAPTFARDAEILSRAGFRVVSAEPLLLFPQTAHFESVAVLRRG